MQMGSSPFMTITSSSKSSQGRSRKCDNSSSCLQSATLSWWIELMVGVFFTPKILKTSFFSLQVTRAFGTQMCMKQFEKFVSHSSSEHSGAPAARW